MKKYLISASLFAALFSSCTYETAAGEQHVSILFWFFVAAISIGTIVLLWLIFRKYKKKK